MLLRVTHTGLSPKAAKTFLRPSLLHIGTRGGLSPSRALLDRCCVLGKGTPFLLMDRVSECRCVKTCEAVVQSDSGQVGLWVEMLDRYIYYFEVDCDEALARLGSQEFFAG